MGRADLSPRRFLLPEGDRDGELSTRTAAPAD
jgi:hypothetical protein